MALPESPEGTFGTHDVLDVPESVREVSEQVTAHGKAISDQANAQAKDAYAKMRTAVQETANLVQDSCSTASKRLSVLSLKAVEHARTNASAYFEHVTELMRAKSIPDAIEINGAFAKKMTYTLTAQAKELSELAQNMATEAAGSIKTHLDGTFKLAA